MSNLGPVVGYKWTVKQERMGMVLAIEEGRGWQQEQAMTIGENERATTSGGGGGAVGSRAREEKW